MSYCVNCGVELDESAIKCPLCSAPVLNAFEDEPEKLPPYPDNTFTPKAKNKYMGFFISMCLIIPNIVFGISNLLVPSSGNWSLYIITSSALFWIIFIAPLFITKAHPYVLWFLDSVAVSLYALFVISDNKSPRWFLHLALPVIACVSAFALFMLFWMRKKKRKWSEITIAIFTEIAILSVVIDGFYSNFYGKDAFLRFSIPIVASCAALIIFFAIVSGNKRFELWFKRTFHV